MNTLSPLRQIWLISFVFAVLMLLLMASDESWVSLGNSFPTNYAAQVTHPEALSIQRASTAHELEEVDSGGSDVRPNLLLIVADDLGYTDIGAFGSEIPTPNLDALAANGLLLTNLRVSPTCAPTRASLMTGLDSHRVGLGNMREVMTLAAPQFLGLPGYEGHLVFDGKTLPDALGDLGYQTFMAGKWHLGTDPHNRPNARGFDRSYALLEGASAHFDDRQITPGELSDHVLFSEDDDLVRPPADFYSTKSFSTKFISYLDEAKNDPRPFFGYLAYTAPHWPLQAPQESIAVHQGDYDEGYDVIYQRRLARQKQLGLVDEEFLGHTPEASYRTWNELDEQEKSRSARTMEVYAAMISDMDAEIGRVLDKIDTIGRSENTIVVFLSDNGATEGGHIRHPIFKDFLNKNFDRSYIKIGSPDSYTVLGDGWSRVSSGANKLAKGFTMEGGIHSPGIISAPGIFLGSGRWNRRVHVNDLYPAFLALAGAPDALPAHISADAAQVGRAFASMLGGKDYELEAPITAHGWEFNGNRAMISGKYKAVFNRPPRGSGEWELYDLTSDRHEEFDLAEKEPVLLKEMVERWFVYAQNNGVILEISLDRKPL